MIFRALFIIVFYDSRVSNPQLSLGVQCTTTFSLIICIQLGQKKHLSEEFLPIEMVTIQINMDQAGVYGTC